MLSRSAKHVILRAVVDQLALVGSVFARWIAALPWMTSGSSVLVLPNIGSASGLLSILKV